MTPDTEGADPKLQLPHTLVGKVAREAIDDAFIHHVGNMEPSAVPSVSDPFWPTQGLQLFDSQLGSRHLDLAARALRAEGKGYYTIGSSGHEGNAAIAAAVRPSDPALLHYRSGAFYVERGRQVPGIDPLRDVLLSLMGAADEPIAGGRHKVFGRAELGIIPQTSTIGSHIPRALGLAFSIGLAHKLGQECPWPADSVVVCSFGDASVNHSTVAGGINSAIQGAYRRLSMPLLLVCEDNGLGISVPTPSGWIERTFRDRPGLAYFFADGSDLQDTYAAAAQAVEWVRNRRRPAFLHVRTVRLMAHAGSDVEIAYRSPTSIAGDIERDPLWHSARALIHGGVLTPDEVLSLYESKRNQVSELIVQLGSPRQLTDAAEVIRPLAPRDPLAVAELAGRTATVEERHRMMGSRLPENEGPLTLAQSINRTLRDILSAYPEAIVFGEDVAVKGGVYGVTRGLLRRAGAGRVFDTLLDEQTILGLAAGGSLAGLLPIAEIQYLAYFHNAADQIRGEAASLQFFANGQFRNPMIVRIPGLAYQEGFGGHFHNDNGLAALRDIPGIVVACLSHPVDAPEILRSCMASAVANGSVCVVIEPIALYHTRDLYEKSDDQWTAPYVAPKGWSDVHVPLGSARTHGTGGDLTMVTFGNGVRMSMRVARRLQERGIGVRVVDLRWLAPLPSDDILRQAEATGRVLVVDETRQTGGVSESIVTSLVDQGFEGSIGRIASADSFIPLGDAARCVLVSEDGIEAAAIKLVTGDGRRRSQLSKLEPATFSGNAPSRG
jgi:2-oxoisovalerate dehydrogenase E1 component